jgi:hypothetical protein
MMSRFAALLPSAFLALLLLGCSRSAQVTTTESRLTTRILALKCDVFKNAFVQRSPQDTLVLLIELGHDQTVEGLTKQLPKRFELGTADYAGGEYDTLFRDDEIQISIASEQRCSAHTLVTVAYSRP